ncbi:hypothetical protein [Pseudomonas simiae]|uniref:hypothetical protein n=1 Tax=Pseudomonas simiae TaxID=321846 RepID=UPI0011B1FB2E|nr:hypothetical protein [Pseudomonas simiae]
MKLLKLVPILFITSLLSACDSGTFTPGACGMKGDNKNMIDYGNSERCGKDDQTTFLYLFMSGTALETVSAKDEARTGVKEAVDNSVTLTAQKQQAESSVSTIRWAYVSLMAGGIAVLFSIFLYFRLGFAWATNEKDPKQPETRRYERWAFFLPALGMIMLCPWPWGEVGKDPYTTFATRWYVMYVKHSNYVEAMTAASIGSSTQAEGLTTNELTEEARVYSATRAKAKRIAGGMVSAELSDLRTSKYQLQKDNMFAPVANRRTEYQQAPQIVFDDKGFAIFRTKDGNSSISSALTVTARFDLEITAKMKASIERKSKLISNGYLTYSVDTMENDLYGFKNDLMSSYELKQSTQEINNAVILQAAHSTKQIYSKFYLDNRAEIRKIARLYEEEQCSFPESSKVPDVETFNKPQREYIKFLKGEKEMSYDNAIDCIGEPETGNFVVYGMRTREEVAADKRAAIVAFTSKVDRVVEKIQAAQINTTVDESNSSACVEARQRLGTGWAANYRECLSSTKQNKSLINAISNYSFMSYGGASYVDTSLALKGNQDYNALMDVDFDPIVNDALAAVESKASIREMSSTEYVENLIQNNMGDTSGLEANIRFMLNPFSEIKKDIGLTKACREKWYSCIDSQASLIALNNVADRMIEGGAFIAFSSLAISKIANKFDKADDKSKHGTSMSNKKKDKSFMGKMLSSAKLILEQLTPVAFIILISGLLLKYILGMSTLIFTIIFVMLIIEILVKLIIANARFMFLFTPQDKDNLKSNFQKLAGEYIYMVWIKSIVMLLQALYFTTYGMVLFTACYACILKAEQSFEDAVFMAILLVPLLYMITVGYLKAYVALISKFISWTGGNDALVEAVNETIDTAFNIVTLGVPLWLVWATKKSNH